MKRFFLTALLISASHILMAMDALTPEQSSALSRYKNELNEQYPHCVPAQLHANVLLALFKDETNVDLLHEKMKFLRAKEVNPNCFVQDTAGNDVPLLTTLTNQVIESEKFPASFYMLLQHGASPVYTGEGKNNSALDAAYKAYEKNQLWAGLVEILVSQMKPESCLVSKNFSKPTSVAQISSEQQ